MTGACWLAPVMASAELLVIAMVACPVVPFAVTLVRLAFLNEPISHLESRVADQGSPQFDIRQETRDIGVSVEIGALPAEADHVVRGLLNHGIARRRAAAVPPHIGNAAVGDLLAVEPLVNPPLRLAIDDDGLAVERDDRWAVRAL